MKDLESITQSLSVTLKKKGYKKSGLSWRKEKQLLTVFFSVEKSQYSTDTWYYWFGIYLHKLSEGKRQTIGNCQIKHRVDNVVNRVFVSVESIVSLIDRWESMYGDISSLRRCAIQGNLPTTSTLNARKYLTSIDFSQYSEGEE